MNSKLVSWSSLSWRVLFVAVLAGCASVPVVQRDGFRLGAEAWGRDEAEIRRRAAFEFTCDPAQIKVAVLSGLASGKDYEWTVAKQVGVDACGQRAVYVRTAMDSWVMNTSQPGTTK